jgi:S-(hydroxymethyl)glutathione dehydrogenase / alcohol dehydrogenase
VSKEVMMKAAVCYEFGKPLVVEEVDLDPPKGREVRVRIGATAICHSDIHILRGELGMGVPVVAGHESAGYIEEVGESVTSLKRGDTVVVSLLKSCGQCLYCRTGRSWMCQFPWPHIREGRIHNKKGDVLQAMTGVGSFAEYVIVDQSQCVMVPSELPIDRMALLACGVITGFGAVVNRAQVRPMESVVIIGIGGVGLNSVQGAAISGANPIIAVDVLDNKLEFARTFGATHTVRADSPDAVKQVQDLTGGRGADYVIVTVGSASAVQQGYMMAGPRGMVVVVGLSPRGQTITLPPFSVVEKVLTSTQMGSTRLAVDVPKLVDLYRAKKLKLDELITKHYKLDDINEAIAAVVSGDAIRNVIMF